MTDLAPYMNMLAQFHHLKTLSLYDNRLKQLPPDMKLLENIQSLDISNNPLNDVQQTIEALKTLPNLRILKYQVKKQKQAVVYQNLKKLEMFNDFRIIRQAPKKPMALKYMKPEVLNTFKKQMLSQFLKIQNMQQNYLQQKSGEYVEQKFIQQMDTIINDSNRVLLQKQGQMTQSLQIIYFNKTKYEIYQFVKNRCINIAMDYYGDLGKMIKQILDVQNKLFESILHESIKLVQYQYEINQIQRQNKDKNIIDPLLQKKILQKNEQLQKQIKRIKKKVQQLNVQNYQIQIQNKNYLQMLFRYSKNDKNSFYGINTAGLSPQVVKKSNNQSFSQVGNSVLIPKGVQRTHSPSPIPHRQNMSHLIAPKGNRNLTLSQLKKTIQEIYANKVKYDKKNFEAHVPLQTMHQFLFTHLNQKYGLKNLTIDAASSIVSAIQAYTVEDNDVAVFGKILKNEIDQDFRNNQNFIKAKLLEYVREIVKSKGKFRGETQIESLVKQKINGELISTQAEDIINSLFPKNEGDKMIHKLQTYYLMNRQKQEQTQRRFRDETQISQKQKKKIQFSVFQKIILDFELKYRERELKPIVVEFKTKDRDQDGIINDEEFSQIITDLCEDVANLIPEMLTILDPYETKSITFSQLINLVSSYPQGDSILSRFHEGMDNQIDEIE